MMAKFNVITIGEIFCDGETGDYYIKKTEKTAWLYDIAEDHECLDADFQEIQRAFSPDHQVEDI